MIFCFLLRIKDGIIVSIYSCALFRDHINSCSLLNMEYMGQKYTWKGSIDHGGPIYMKYLIVPYEMLRGEFFLQMLLSGPFLG